MSIPLVSRIVLNPDGSEDDNFCCIQADGVAVQAREELSAGTALVTQDKDGNDHLLTLRVTKNWNQRSCNRR